jgi:hypothetical protein
LRLVARGVAEKSSEGAPGSALRHAAPRGNDHGQRHSQRQRDADEQQAARGVAQRASRAQASARHETSDGAQHAAAAPARAAAA